MTSSLTPYLKAIEQALLAGNATEHTHRPALKALIETLAPGVKAINEPQRIACGAPDLVVLGAGPNTLDPASCPTIGYIEAKDVGKSLDEAEATDQLKRYRRALPNLILMDSLEFRWYVDGERREVARLARPAAGGKLVAERAGARRSKDYWPTSWPTSRSRSPWRMIRLMTALGAAIPAWPIA